MSGHQKSWIYEYFRVMQVNVTQRMHSCIILWIGLFTPYKCWPENCGWRLYGNAQSCKHSGIPSLIGHLCIVQKAKGYDWSTCIIQVDIQIQVLFAMSYLRTTFNGDSPIIADCTLLMGTPLLLLMVCMLLMGIPLLLLAVYISWMWYYYFNPKTADCIYQSRNFWSCLCACFLVFF